MSVGALFELEDFTETRQAWQIVPDWELCGLCGGKTSFNQGGTSTGGAVCDPCATLDGCRLRDDGDPRHVSRWGMRHAVEDHDRLMLEQARRRARHLAKIAEATS